MNAPLGKFAVSFLRSLLVTFALLAVAAPAVAQSTAANPAADLPKLAWISGSWATSGGKVQSEEYWTDTTGNMLLGMSRTLAGGKVVFFEFLRIEARPDGIYYVAQPKGRPGTDFKLTRLSDTEAVFENPAHDFPKRIIYRRNSDGSLTARIDGGEGVQKGAQEFPFRPKKQ